MLIARYCSFGLSRRQDYEIACTTLPRTSRSLGGKQFLHQLSIFCIESDLPLLLDRRLSTWKMQLSTA